MNICDQFKESMLKWDEGSDVTIINNFLDSMKIVFFYCLKHPNTKLLILSEVVCITESDVKQSIRELRNHSILESREEILDMENNLQWLFKNGSIVRIVRYSDFYNNPQREYDILVCGRHRQLCSDKLSRIIELKTKKSRIILS